MTGTDVATYTRERPGMSAFVLEDGVVYHTYSTYARGLDGLWGMYQSARRWGATRRRASGGAATTSTTSAEPSRDLSSKWTENWVKPGRGSHFFLPYPIFPPSTTFSPSLRSVPSGATCP